MATSTTPTYPVVDESVVITDTSLVGTVAVVEITSVPSLSTKETGFLTLSDDDPPISALSVAIAELETSTTTFDEPGEYGVTIYDVRRWDGAPEFDEDQGGELFYELLATYSGTVHVGFVTDLPMLAANGSGAILRLTINDRNVRAATIVNATTEAARVAALQTTVTGALIAIVGDTVTAMGTALQTGVNDLRVNYEAHRVLIAGPVHPIADNTNSVDQGDADSQEGAISLLNEIRTELIDHMRNSTAAAARWHAVGEDDFRNLPITGQAADLASATVVSAELRERCYERHRIQELGAGAPPENNPPCHTNDDAVNTLTAPTDLDSLIVAYLDALANEDPTAVTGESEGGIDAEHMYGFERPE